MNYEELLKIEGFNHYEERQLFNLILLRHSDTRIIYITSQPLDHSILEYYWQLLPGEVSFSKIQDQLLLFCTYDNSPKPLSLKLLERPRLIERIRRSIRKNESCLTCFNSTSYETGLSRLLGVPLLAVDTPHLWWGTKAGSRQIFSEVGVPFPRGTNYNIRDVDILAEQIAKIHLEDPTINRKFVIKLNEGFSGKGNALLDIDWVDPYSENAKDLVSSIKNSFDKLKFQAHETWESFRRKIQKIGCIVEVFLDSTVSSPSFQACVDISGEIISLSTHEQVFDTENKQVYLGCSFPAHQSYRLQIQEYGKLIGKKLAEKGVIDHFGVDFIVVPLKDQDTFLIYAIEINLRQGGTTHPMMTLKLLTEGSYDEISGTFRSEKGQEKYYVSSDNVIDPNFKGLLPHDIIEIFCNSTIHYNHSREKGVVFHLLGALSQYGKIGITAIGDTPIEASEIYDSALKLLKEVSLETSKQKNKILQFIKNPNIMEPTH